MNATADHDLAPLDLLPADTAARLIAFARSCKAAARAVALYPAEHPAVDTALAAVETAAGAATEVAALTMTVTPETLTIDGRRLAKPDTAVNELAALLHAHEIGQLIVEPRTPVDVWRRFLVLLSVPPDQARLRGGLARLWSSEGQTLLEVRRIDYGELLRDRTRGDRATWDAIAASCLMGDTIAGEEWMLDMLGEMLEQPEQAGELLTALESRLPKEGGRGPVVLGGLIQALAQFVSQVRPEQLETLMSAIARAATRLPVATLGPMFREGRAGSRPGLGRFLQDLANRVADASIAEMVASEIRGGRGTSGALADAFCGLSPDSTRRSAILTLARQAVVPPDAPADGPAAVMFTQSEDLLLTYSDTAFVSDAYDRELKQVADRAVDLDNDATDSPERIAAWSSSVSEAAVHLLDAQMLVDLMTLQSDVRHWRELADLAVARINMLVVVGDFPSASHLVGALHQQAATHETPAVQAAATALLDHVLNAATMRHVASHLDTVDRHTIEAARRFCLALGTTIVGPLAEVLSREERTRARQHLVDILLGLGSAGRQAIERLKHSPNAAVRRTAVLLLREFGGQNALLDLESLLNDSEPNVQRDATRAIAMMNSDAAFDTLTRALATGTDHARSVISAVLSTIPDEEALPILARVVRHGPCRGAMWAIHERAIQRMGSIGGPVAIDVLNELMYKRVVWSPFKVATLRHLAADALARIATPAALAALRAAAAAGPRGAKSPARRHVAALEAAPISKRDDHDR